MVCHKALFWNITGRLLSTDACSVETENVQGFIMATDIKMPQLSDTMSSGKILTWKKNEGDTVNRGDILAEVETDKANLEIESFFNGTLLKVLVPAGSNAKVGEVIAVIGAAGESVAAGGASSAATKPAAPQPTPAAAAPQAAPARPTPVPTAPSSGPLGVVASSQRIKASPLAKKVAEDLQVNLSSVQGSGPNGRIVRRDVEAAAGGGSAAPSLQTHAAPQAYSTKPANQVPAPQAIPAAGTLTPLSRMRETIARRMQESVTTAPHFYCTTSVNMGEALRLREILKEKAEYKGISVNHLVIKAVAYGLRHEPRVNAAMKDGQVYQPGQINIGIITALEDGLIIPVLKEVDAMSLKDVVFEARAAIDRARAGRPSSSDLSGGTFSISNMGMFDVENFTAIINPGQGGILAVSAVKEQPIVQKGQIVIGSLMKATVSVDHRIIDGVMASTFLKHFKEALEVPALLMA
jgi:pyruvate dehydrogenase E2 component (dihydrolipoamide acetyltransferase)